MVFLKLMHMEYQVNHETILGQGGPSSTQCSNPSWACHWHHKFGTAPTTTLYFYKVLNTKHSVPHWNSSLCIMNIPL